MNALRCAVSVAWLMAAALNVSVQAQDDPLPPDQVFRYSARADAERIHVDFDVLDGYYLYRGRFGFDSGTDGVALGAARFPRGESHSDEFFGEQEIYRHDFTIEVPYRRTDAASSLTLRMRLQGCADVGLCYPPQNWTREVELPAAPPAAAVTTSLFGTAPAADGLLPVEEAFVMNARLEGANELTVGWQIAPGYYLYRDKLGFATSGGIELGRATLPEGRPHRDLQAVGGTDLPGRGGIFLRREGRPDARGRAPGSRDRVPLEPSRHDRPPVARRVSSRPQRSARRTYDVRRGCGHRVSRTDVLAHREDFMGIRHPE